MGDLESLKAVTSLSFLSGDVENRVDEFSSLSVVAFSPVVSGSGLTEDEVVGSEELAEGSGSDGVHGSRFKVHKNSSGDVSTPSGFVIVYVDHLELEVRVAVVGAGGVDSMLVGDDLPELCTNLVAALPALYVNDFSHFKR